MKNNLLFLLLLFIGTFAQAQTYTTGVVTLSTTSGLAMTAKMDVGTQVTLTLTGPATRWFALGFDATSMGTGNDVVTVHAAGTLSALIPGGEDGTGGATSFLGFQITNLYEFFILFIIMSGAAAAILFVLSSWLEKRMHNDHVEGQPE